MTKFALSFDQLRTANLLRCRRWHKNGVNDWSLSDWAVAMVGEAGEACNIVKKLNRDRDQITGNKTSADELRDALARELADTLIYLDLLAASEGIDLSEAVVETFNAKSIEVGFPERL